MPRAYEHLKRRTRIYDRWWPLRHGIITKRLKTVLYVLWSDGEVVKYDLPHMQFLEKAKHQ